MYKGRAPEEWLAKEVQKEVRRLQAVGLGRAATRTACEWRAQLGCVVSGPVAREARHS